jgi:hypothetical protein
LNSEKIVGYKRKLVLRKALAVGSLLIFTVAAITTITTIQNVIAQLPFGDSSSNVDNTAIRTIISL